jgi:hypothetical protein
MRRALSVGAVVPLVASIAGCVTPARNEPQFKDKATSAVQAASADVATGLLVLQQDQEKKVFRTYADEVVTASETSMGSISASFASVQPPDKQSGDVRDTVTGVLSTAEDALAHARIAVRRGDHGALAKSERELRSVADELDKIEKDLG